MKWQIFSLQLEVKSMRGIWHTSYMYFSTFIANIEIRIFDRRSWGAISFERFFIPGNSWVMDKTMEEIFMRHVKYNSNAHDEELVS